MQYRRYIVFLVLRNARIRATLFAMAEKLPTERVADLVKAVRPITGTRQHQIAEELGLSLSQYSRWENNRVLRESEVRDEKLRGIARRLVDEVAAQI